MVCFVHMLFQCIYSNLRILQRDRPHFTDDSPILCIALYLDFVTFHPAILLIVKFNFPRCSKGTNNLLLQKGGIIEFTFDKIC